MFIHLHEREAKKILKYLEKQNKLTIVELLRIYLQLCYFRTITLNNNLDVFINIIFCTVKLMRFSLGLFR